MMRAWRARRQRGSCSRSRRRSRRSSEGAASGTHVAGTLQRATAADGSDPPCDVEVRLAPSSRASVPRLAVDLRTTLPDGRVVTTTHEGVVAVDRPRPDRRVEAVQSVATVVMYIAAGHLPLPRDPGYERRGDPPIDVVDEALRLHALALRAAVVPHDGGAPDGA